MVPLGAYDSRQLGSARMKVRLERKDARSTLTGNPFLAKLIAGVKSDFQGREPCRSHSVCQAVMSAMRSVKK